MGFFGRKLLPVGAGRMTEVIRMTEVLRMTEVFMGFFPDKSGSE